MKKIDNYLLNREADWANHPVFQRLSTLRSLDEFRGCAQVLTFWIMSFQDLIKFNTLQFQDPKLRQIAETYLSEDIGHEQWFLQDLQSLSITVPSVQELYCQSSASIRQATYQLLAEVFRATNDYERLALLFAVESVANVFFKNISRVVEKFNYSQQLKYFSDNHLTVECEHDFLVNNESYLKLIELTPEQETSIFALLHRVESSFNLILNTLVELLDCTRLQESQTIILNPA
ncbi:conserved hypothetical protein [Gloeothece citriformis PCC 7424]|uniref:Transcriptional activator, TenA family n=1 Tax=Gloeothece citriformis (strain PCC 7424) TaxID=65393 RepID=B7K6T9_GLOC7|nr:hypothetical protein [Gloeothece citriformis]ACK72638.1 conserved hypothetical protein [Gloeothece citriformis PCC 7424]